VGTTNLADVLEDWVLWPDPGWLIQVE
jgi:hypothetical protein